MQRWVSIRQVTPPRKAAILPSSDPSRPGASNRPRCVYALRDQVDIWALSDLCTPWCVHVVATLRIADHIADGITQINELAAASGSDADSLHRVLLHLVGKGLFEESAPGQFGLNEPARGLLAMRLGFDLDGIGGR